MPSRSPTLVAASPHPPWWLVIALTLTVTLSACGSGPQDVSAQMTGRLVIRGQPQTLRLYGPRKGDPVIVSSGDGGWIHLAPHVADVLSRSGFFVVGFDTRAYLASFTSRGTTVRSQLSDGKLILLDEDGTLALATATPQNFEVHSQVALLEKTAWTPLTMVGTRLYVRDRTSIVALDLAAPRA